MDSDLPVAGCQVKSGEVACLVQLVKKVINPRKWIGVQSRHCIEPSIVNTEPV